MGGFSPSGGSDSDRWINMFVSKREKPRERQKERKLQWGRERCTQL